MSNTNYNSIQIDATLKKGVSKKSGLPYIAIEVVLPNGYKKVVFPQGAEKFVFEQCLNN